MSDNGNASRKSASASTRRAARDGTGDGFAAGTDGRTAVAPSRGEPGDERPPLRGLSDYDYTNFYFAAGTDPFGILEPFGEWWKDAEFDGGYYLYGLPMGSAPATRVEIGDPKTSETHARD